MTNIFVSHTKENAECAEQIRQGLEAKGYAVWREPPSLTLESILYPRTIENVILGSVAIVLVWSSSAAQSEWVKWHTLFAQDLKKLVLPVVIDGTNLPNTLVVDTPIMSQASCIDAIVQLLQHLPSPQSTDPLILLIEQAAHEFIRVRKEAIDAAAEMLKRDEHQEEVLALLKYLASKDTITGVREKAQGVLDAGTKKAVTPQQPSESRHNFSARCRNGHATYFDKRRVCPPSGVVVRSGLDELRLKCGQCGEELTVHVDCKGYR